MILNQLGRRNLSPEAQSYFRGLQYRHEKGRARLVDSSGAHSGPRPEGRAVDRVAELNNVSKNTIKRDNDFAIGLDIVAKTDPEIKAEVMRGGSKINRKDIQAIGQKKKNVGDLRHVKQKSKTQTNKITPRSIAEIAFTFLNNWSYAKLVN